MTLNLRYEFIVEKTIQHNATRACIHKDSNLRMNLNTMPPGPVFTKILILRSLILRSFLNCHFSKDSERIQKNQR